MENGLTHEQLVIACRNIGYDLTCGQCASVFYTGIGIYPHDSTCKTPKSEGAVTVTVCDGTGNDLGDCSHQRTMLKMPDGREVEQGGPEDRATWWTCTQCNFTGPHVGTDPEGKTLNPNVPRMGGQ